MQVDVRWLILVAVVVGAVVLARWDARWADPLAVGVALAGLLYVVLRLR